MFSVLAIGALLTLAAVATNAQVVYDSTVSPLPGNIPSVGAEAYSFTELGDEVTFAGTSRRLNTVTITMSSWGCQAGHWYDATCVTAPGATFSIPITLKIYNPGLNNTAGSVVTTRTQTFNIPYRPSSDTANCTGGRWYQASTATCFNGMAANITFDFTSMNVTLPNTAVFGVSYNTSHYGPAPIGESPACYSSSAGCAYDSLNIGLGSVVSTGVKPFFRTVFQNAVFGGDYCDGGADGVGIMRLDSLTNQCWFDSDPQSSTFGQSYIPAAKFFASNPPSNKDQCKGDGWKTFTRADGSTFKNQGDCIQYANTGK